MKIILGFIVAVVCFFGAWMLLLFVPPMFGVKLGILTWILALIPALAVFRGVAK